MTELIKRLRDTASKGVSVWGDLQMEAAVEIERLTDQNLRIGRGQFGQMCSHCGWETPASGGAWADLQAHTAVCEKHPIKALREEVEQLRVQLAGCGVAAMQNTEQSKASRAKPGDYGYSESYGDVCRAVDREIALRERIEQMEPAQ